MLEEEIVASLWGSTSSATRTEMRHQPLGEGILRGTINSFDRYSLRDFYWIHKPNIMFLFSKL
jgi:hypothetical protein